LESFERSSAALELPRVCKRACTGSKFGVETAR
jgi:hypothetical protein